MTRKRKNEPSLTPRQGKVLRFIVSRSSGIRQAPVEPAEAVNKIEWSDLPNSIMQALNTFTELAKLELIEKIEGGYQATTEGMGLIEQANKQGWWRK